MKVNVLNNREHFEEINALIGTVAKALNLPDKQVVEEIEAGTITLDLDQDENGHRFVAVHRGDTTARVYQGAIRHAPDAGSSDPADG